MSFIFLSFLKIFLNFLFILITLFYITGNMGDLYYIYIYIVFIIFKRKTLFILISRV